MAGWRFTTPGQEARRAEREGRTRPPIDWRGELRFWFSRSTYTRRTAPILMQLGIWLAVGTLFFLHADAWRRSGSGLSAATTILLFAILAYPFVRYRIERGRWPD
ncbi:hypothetical protein [Methylobacterium sp. J-092]|jgi:hypothetical protein|nr:hypothetical protein [Methylobacterium sp. J-092]MCJ2009862.1 hypothetical protein [Methylobacterium sp. J-092]